MKTFILAAFFATYALCRIADAKAYVPLGALESTPASTRSVFLPAKAADRPFLPGMRPAEVELMEDALRRKNPNKIGNNRNAAHESIIRNFLRDPVKRAHAKGMLAEALYLEKNATWGYVKSPNAPQHDLYTWINGRRTPFTAQVKTHSTPNTPRYARDMLSDHRSNLFLIPDDHVAPLKAYWRQQLEELRGRGLAEEAENARRQLARVRGLGFTAKELDDHFTRAARDSLRERNATYVSLGASLALALGPDLWEWWRTGSLSRPTLFRMGRAGSILAADRAVAYGLAKYGTGALRGGLRGNVITGLVIVAVDTSFSIYENGGAKAFRSPEFYAHLGGTVSSLTLGLAVGGPVSVYVTAAASETGPWAPVIGGAAGLVSGGVAGAAGYIGGESASRKILEAVNPDFLHDAENAAIRDARDHIEASIAALQREEATFLIQ